MFRVSTIGDYYPRGEKARQTIGSGENEFFESMVFELVATPEPKNEGCGCFQVASYADPLACRRYATAGEAQAGHEELVEKFMRLSDMMWQEGEQSDE